MISFDLSWPAVGLAAAAFVAIGFLWFHPLVFGRRRARLSGRPPETARIELPEAAILLAVGAATVLAMLVRAVGAATPVDGAIVGIVGWFGLGAGPSLAGHLGAGRPLAIWALEAGPQLAGFAAMGAILGEWL
jgi:hypothetical protein